VRWKAWASAPSRPSPRIPDDVRIYAIGDVHGRADLLQRMLSTIDRTLAAYPVKNVIQVLLGDYIDRGPNSREVIETLVTRARRHPMIYLKGNTRVTRRNSLAIRRSSASGGVLAACTHYSPMAWSRRGRNTYNKGSRTNFARRCPNPTAASSTASRYPLRAAISFLRMPA
jgi:hypothetical protein